MPLIINSNTTALGTQRRLAASQGVVGTSMQRLSSGLRINSAKDDSAGLAIASRMTSQVKGVAQAARGINDGISMLQTADGALAESVNLVQRVRELAVQSANATNSVSDRAALNQEVSGLLSELERLSNVTQFNGQKLLDGSVVNQMIQTGANASERIGVRLGKLEPPIYNVVQTTGLDGFGADAVANQPWGINGVTAGTINLLGQQSFRSVEVNNNEPISAVAERINAQSGGTGIVAEATTSMRFGPFIALGLYKLTIQSANAVPETVSFNLTSIDTAGMTVIADAFNAVRGATGVTASVGDIPGFGPRVFFLNSNGADISFGDTTFSNPGNVSVLKTTPQWGTHVSVQILTQDTTAQSVTGSGSLIFTSISDFTVVGSGTNVVLSTPISASVPSVAKLDVRSAWSAQWAISMADSTLASLSEQRSKLGAMTSRFESSLAGLQTSLENLTASRGRIEDTDFAQETATLSKSQILQQSTAAMLVQANQQAKQVLSLLL
jgi:flagellin